MIKIATIDLYNNERNEGMRCIKEIVSEAKARNNEIEISYKVLIPDTKMKFPELKMISSFHRADPEVRLKVKVLCGKKITSTLFKKSGTTTNLILKERNICSSSVIHSR